MWKVFFFHCLLCSSFWVEEPQISRVFTVMLKLWRTPVAGLRIGVSGQVGSAKPEQCSAAEGVVPCFSCKAQRPCWTITVEQLSQ